MSPDQKGIETLKVINPLPEAGFTMSPDQKGIETFGLQRFRPVVRSQ